MQCFLENLVAKRVENFYLNGLRAALGIRKNAIIHANIAYAILDGVNPRFFYINGEFALVIRCGLTAFFQKVYCDTLEAFTLVVRNGTRNGICRRHSAKSENARCRE